MFLGDRMASSGGLRPEKPSKMSRALGNQETERAARREEAGVLESALVSESEPRILHLSWSHCLRGKTG